MTTPSKLVLTMASGQEQEFTLSAASVSLGRGTANEIVLRDAKVSRVHARLEASDAGYALVDLGSANGTHVNGTRIERVTLASGDVITVGDSTLRFEVSPPRSEPEVTRIDSAHDIEATLTQAAIPMTLTDTRMARLAIHTPRKTWEVPLVADAVTLGRDPGSDIFLDDPKVSRRHARIEQRSGLFILRDLGSANGTWLGERHIEERTLQGGDVIRIGEAHLVFKPGFSSDALTLVDVPARAVTHPPVVFIPGLTGSELWLGNERVWPNPRLLLTRPELFRLTANTPIEARGIIRELVIVPNLIKIEAYSRIGDYLEESLGYERGKDLLEFGYDWRQDVRVSAQRLAKAIDQWSVTAPVTIIAHSLGCLVSRYYVQCLGGDRQVGRLILMGGPQIGTPGALAQLALGPKVLPFGLMGDRVREVASTFPSCYQILPNYPCVLDQNHQPIDILSDPSWVNDQQRPLLQCARDFWREVSGRSKVPAISIFGYGIKTVTGVNVQRDADLRWTKIDSVNETVGDSAVPVRSAVLEGSEIHPVQQNHGVLYIDNDVKMRLKLELTLQKDKV
ncbi:MAG: FHA domain-containing protein [Chloroflexi bacterium]|nr:FHA domain-containing protein [Chloroflexota bacterium]